MKKSWILIILVVIAVAGVLVWRVVQPQAVVEVIRPVVGSMSAYIEEQAVTELPQDYLIAMPIPGWLERIDLREGDHVTKGQVVARLETDDLKDRVLQAQQRIAVLETQIDKTKDHRLEQNALVETEAMVKAINETVQASDAKLKASQAVWEFARSEAERLRRITETGSATAREMREAETQSRKANAEYQGDRLELAALKTIAAVSYIGPKFIRDYIDRKNFDLTTTERQLDEAKAQAEIERRNLSRAEITCPIDGVVLQRYQTRRQYLTAGVPLLTVGNLDDMEVRAEILTERATRIKPGDPVEIYGEAIGVEPVSGKVLRVWPEGFKKISSLGVEQQRVNVSIALDHRPARLGVAFRVQVRIRTAEAKGVLTLPRTALFRGRQGDWQVMVVRDGETELATVKLGLTNDDRAQVAEGLTQDDAVLARPSREITPGMRVETIHLR